MQSAAHPVLAVVIGLALIFPATAQEGGTLQTKKKARDPNEMICEQEQVLGSRLAVRRVCMTRSQWEERRAADREQIQRTQLAPCMPTKGSSC